MIQEQKDQKDFDIRIHLENALIMKGRIDTDDIDFCIKEHNATFYNVDQILEALVEEGCAVLSNGIYIKNVQVTIKKPFQDEIKVK